MVERGVPLGSPSLTHASGFVPDWLSPYPSPSESSHWVASFGNASAVPEG